MTPYLANGSPRACWNCGKPFIVRDERAEAIVGHNDRLYCHRAECEQAALVPLVHALPPASMFRQAA
jgi:hypothetical protein